MVEIKADESDQIFENFREAVKRFKDYIKYIKTIPETKQTMKQKELIAKYGKDV